MTCPLCQRQLVFPSDHHLTPKCRGGDDKVTICQDCHSQIHTLFSNKELESKYNSVDAIMANELFVKAVKFIAKQDPSRKIKIKLSNAQKGRGRNG